MTGAQMDHYECELAVRGAGAGFNLAAQLPGLRRE